MLKDLKSNTYEEMFNKFKEMIMQIYKSKKYIYNLLDEYDVPIERGYIKGYYEKVVSLIKDIFSSSLKDNDYLNFSL